MGASRPFGAFASRRRSLIVGCDRERMCSSPVGSCDLFGQPKRTTRLPRQHAAANRGSKAAGHRPRYQHHQARTVAGQDLAKRSDWLRSAPPMSVPHRGQGGDAGVPARMRPSSLRPGLKGPHADRRLASHSPVDCAARVVEPHHPGPGFRAGFLHQGLARLPSAAADQRRRDPVARAPWHNPRQRTAKPARWSSTRNLLRVLRTKERIQTSTKCAPATNRSDKAYSLCWLWFRPRALQHGD
jgi:hypothetical protein